LDICSVADIYGFIVNADGGIRNICDVCKGLVRGAISFISKIGVNMNFKSYNVYWEIFKLILFGLSVFVGVGLALSIPLCLLWNWLMPHIFGLPTINILEAFGLSALITLLAPRPLTLNNKQKVDTDDTEKKLEEVLQDITSQFKA
jgi:hypothetical protein